MYAHDLPAEIILSVTMFLWKCHRTPVNVFINRGAFDMFMSAPGDLCDPRRAIIHLMTFQLEDGHRNDQQKNARLEIKTG